MKIYAKKIFSAGGGFGIISNSDKREVILFNSDAVLASRFQIPSQIENVYQAGIRDGEVFLYTDEAYAVDPVGFKTFGLAPGFDFLCPLADGSSLVEEEGEGVFVLSRDGATQALLCANDDAERLGAAWPSSFWICYESKRKKPATIFCGCNMTGRCLLPSFTHLFQAGAFLFGLHLRESLVWFDQYGSQIRTIGLPPGCIMIYDLAVTHGCVRAVASFREAPQHPDGAIAILESTPDCDLFTVLEWAPFQYCASISGDGESAVFGDGTWYDFTKSTWERFSDQL